MDDAAEKEKKKKKRDEVLLTRDLAIRKINLMHRVKPPSPLVQLKDVLEEAADKDRFVGDTMFWKYYEDINIERIYHTDSVEYKNLKIMFWETLFFLILLILFTVYMYSMQSSHVYQARKDQLDYWGGCDAGGNCDLDEVDSVKGFWGWTRNNMVSLAFTHYDYAPSVANLTTAFANNAFSIDFTPRFIGPGMVNVVLGSIRMRQLRVQKNLACVNSKLITHVFPDCYSEYSIPVTSKDEFSSRFVPTYLKGAFQWGDVVTTLQGEMRGKLSTYNGAGFMMDLPNNDTLTRTMMDDLSQWRWLDRATRAIILELTTLNINTNVIVNTRILFEFGPTGTVLTTIRSDAAEAHFLTPSSKAGSPQTVFLLQIVAALLFLGFQGWTLYIMYKSIANFIGQSPLKYMKKHSLKGNAAFLLHTFAHYFKYGWNFVDWLILVLFYVHACYRLLAYSDSHANLMPTVVGHPEYFMPFNPVLRYLVVSKDILALLAIVMWVKPFKYLCMVGYFRRIVRIMEQCVMKLAIFTVMLVVVMFGFSVAFFVGFGGQEEEYAILPNAFLSLTFLLLEGYNLDPAWFTKGTLQLMPLVYLFYIVVMYFVLLNIFVAVVVDIYATSPEKRGNTGENPMVIFVWTYYNAFIGSSLIQEDVVQNLRTEDFSIRLELLPGMVRRKWIERKRRMQKIAGKICEGLELFPGEDYLAEDNRQSLTDWQLPSSSLELEKMKKPEPLKPVNIYDIPERALQEEVSMQQLQRLMDEDETLPLLLNTTEAVEVIRRFKQGRDAGIFAMPMNPEQVKSLQSQVFGRIEHLETFNTDDAAPDVPEVMELAEAMSGAVTDVRNNFRMQLTSIIEATAQLFEHLVDLTQGIDAIRCNHEEVLRVVGANVAPVNFDDDE